MSAKRGGRVGASNNAKGSIGISSIPAGSRKLVQTVKEIVNSPEAEIYAMLKECNMDPNEAVNRLLAQDPFHEVKSKRDKKKENKDSMDPRSRSDTNTSNRSGRGGADCYAGRGRSSQFSSNELSFSHSEPSHKKENGTHASGGSSSYAFGTAGNNINWQHLSHSDYYVNTESKMSVAGSCDAVSSSLQPSSGMKPAWVGVPGQLSMADIVKMGKPQNRAPSMANPPHHSGDSSADHPSKLSQMNTVLEFGASYPVSSNDEWPSIERPPAPSAPAVLEVAADYEFYTNSSKLHVDRGHEHIKSQLDDVPIADDGPVQSLDANPVRPASVSSRSMQEENSTDSSLYDDNLYGNKGSYQAHRNAFEPNEAGDGASSLTANLQQLSLQNNDEVVQPEEDNPSVVIPDHLQVHMQDCAHLSFGSFGSGISSAFSGPFASMPMKNDSEETTEAPDASSMGHLDTRNPEYYGDEHLKNNPDENFVHGPGVNAGNYDSPSVSQPEVLKQETTEVFQGNQYAFPASSPNYTYDNTQQLNAAFNHQQTSTQIQNLAPFSSMMAYTNSLPSTLLASNVQTGREPDFSCSPFPVMQSMSTKYSNTASSVSGPSISMSEALRQGGISTPQPTQTLPGASVATGPALPQHLAVHPYSQHTLPLGHFANMISYPFLPQSYTYMPSAFQQGFAGNNTYHQSLAAMLPQYKNSVSISSLPQTSAIASGYGFGTSTSLPGGHFPLNPPTAPAGTTIGYDDILSSQYKDSNHLISLQQNDNSGMWVHGPGSRTMSAVPGSTYYSFQGQNQQPGGFRQSQQPSQHFGGLGYPNFYHSQTGISLEHQQNTRDGALCGSQGQQPRQTQQLWAE
ncbi:hypothetical protein HS088_TW13G01196 [Tripterygium wilfordii]|uniref:GBF-interacting protein 1 N-terminal domain-containing protein n=1 Tax=Tripterygium wilfordii TaxID=458696 RepID=A0A7J7CW35_TRIWF|nr:uncharacterized protein LOC120013429 [Tripterygium wilfordii]KAF5738300.1 hypothetical protein HS088_TW13G01196 [Tripterygium wilfordii]